MSVHKWLLSPLLIAVVGMASAQAQQARMTSSEIERLPVVGAGAGTSGLPNIQTRLLAGDPEKTGPYTISIQVPPNTKITSHVHRDTRSAVVVSGIWHFGYGPNALTEASRALPAGSYYTEPANVAHFARTGPEGATIYISGIGPSDTRYGDRLIAPAMQKEKSMQLKAKTIVFVHGAFADGSSWNRVIPLLQAQGLNVISVQNPLTSLEADVAHTRRALAIAEAPVVLVGHSWGGVVIGEAGTDPKVSALVFVAALAPAPGEAASDRLKDHAPSPGLSHLRVDAQGFAVLPGVNVATDFAQDLSSEETAVMAATQGPVFAPVFDTKVTNAAWLNKPNSYIIATLDRMLPPAFQRTMAARMKATTVELESGHVPQLSRPADVAAVILKAASQ